MGVIILLQKPYNLSPAGGVAIDANENNDFSWSVSGDVQTAFEIKIYDNMTNSLIWSLPKTYSYSTKYTLPPSTLINGKEYKWRVTVYNEKNQSITSDYQIVQTSSRPTVNVNQIGVVSAPSYLFSAVYSQLEGVPIRSWNVLLYDEDFALIEQSGIKTESILEYLFSNLKSEKSYYIEFQVTSIKGLTNTSGKIKFNVLYTQPRVNANLTAENLSDIAGIRLSWNVIQIIGETDTAPIFIDNEKIDLLNNRVVFSKGFSVSNNFTIKLWIEKPKNKKDILFLKGKNAQMRLQYHAVDEKFHFYKTMNDNNFTTSWVSQQVSGDKYFVVIQQIDRHINLWAEVY
jgi:hypothetical protein